MHQPTTDFGYRQIPVAEKTAKVAQVFATVAPKYDLMNDLMSFGIHRLWKKHAIHHCGLQRGQQILDLAGGTGDLAQAMAPLVTTSGLIVLADINAEMLQHGKAKLTNHGILQPICYLQTNAECLSLPSNFFDGITMAFGLRNVTHKDRAFAEMFRVLKPGGRAVILEFSQVQHAELKKLYDLYSFHILPWLGELVANDKASYQYLVESIRMHPNQDQLLAMMQQAGFMDCSYVNILQGICALHKGFKY